jgi:hypothetical protein
MPASSARSVAGARLRAAGRARAPRRARARRPLLELVDERLQLGGALRDPRRELVELREELLASLLPASAGRRSFGLFWIWPWRSSSPQSSRARRQEPLPCQAMPSW